LKTPVSIISFGTGRDDIMMFSNEVQMS